MSVRQYAFYDGGTECAVRIMSDPGDPHVVTGTGSLSSEGLNQLLGKRPRKGTWYELIGTEAREVGEKLPDGPATPAAEPQEPAGEPGAPAEPRAPAAPKRPATDDAGPSK